MGNENFFRSQPKKGNRLRQENSIEQKKVLLDVSSHMGKIELEEIECLVCHSNTPELICEAKDYESEINYLFKVVKCSSCGFVYTSPRPTLKSLFELFYPDDYICYNSNTNSVSEKIDSYRKRIQNYSRMKSALRYYKNTDLNILDVGCADGSFLKYINERFGGRTTGLEPKEKIASSALKNGLNVIPKTLLNADFEKNTFDIVFMFHVLEHLQDPIANISKVNEILKIGGLFVFEIPVIDGIDRKIFKRYWWGYHLPRHLFHFSLESVNRVIEEAGMKVLAIKPQIRPTIHAWSLQNYIKQTSLPLLVKKFLSMNNPAMTLFFTPMELFFYFLQKTSVNLIIAQRITKNG